MRGDQRVLPFLLPTILTAVQATGLEPVTRPFPYSSILRAIPFLDDPFHIAHEILAGIVEFLCM